MCASFCALFVFARVFPMFVQKRIFAAFVYSKRFTRAPSFGLQRWQAAMVKGAAAPARGGVLVAVMMATEAHRRTSLRNLKVEVARARNRRKEGIPQSRR